MRPLRRMLVWYLDLGYRAGLTITRRTAIFKFEREVEYQDFAALTIMVVFTFPLLLFIIGFCSDQLYRQFDRSERKFLLSGLILTYGCVVIALYKRSGYRPRIKSYKEIPMIVALFIFVVASLMGIPTGLAGAHLSEVLHQLIFR
jgi:hypothetical protein